METIQSPKPIIVYPNLGENYDAVTKTWGAGSSGDDWLALAEQWVQLVGTGYDPEIASQGPGLKNPPQRGHC